MSTLKSGPAVLAGDLVSTSSSPALAHGVSSGICIDRHHTCGGTILLRDAGPVLGRFMGHCSMVVRLPSRKTRIRLPGCDPKSLWMWSPLESDCRKSWNSGSKSRAPQTLGTLKVRDSIGEGLRVLYTTGRHPCSVTKHWDPRG